MKALTVPADRMYWYSWQDVAPDVPVQEGLWFDPRHYHLGAVTHDNQPKLLARLLLEGGVSRLEDVAKLAAPNLSKGAAPIVITGGSGFIGSNLADSFLKDGEDVIILDNLGRLGRGPEPWMAHTAPRRPGSPGARRRARPARHRGSVHRREGRLPPGGPDGGDDQPRLSDR
jgi:hypothetical protein